MITYLVMSDYSSYMCDADYSSDEDYSYMCEADYEGYSEPWACFDPLPYWTDLSHGIEDCDFTPDGICKYEKNGVECPNECIPTLGFKYCETHNCAYRCGLPLLSDTLQGHPGNTCKAKYSNRCRNYIDCDMHNACKEECNYIRCFFPGCNPCLSHCNICSYCHHVNFTLCLLHDKCKCGSPKKIQNPCCGACSLEICANDFLRFFPLEILTYIFTFVKSETQNHDSHDIKNRVYGTSKWTHSDHDIRVHFEEVEEHDDHHNQCDDSQEDYHTWFDYYDPKLGDFCIDCVDVEEEFFKKHTRAY